MTDPHTLQIRREMHEALDAGPSDLATYSPQDIWAAVRDGFIKFSHTDPASRRMVYALADGKPARGDAPVTAYDVPGRVLIDWDNMPCFGCNEIVVPTPALSPAKLAARSWERRVAGLKPEGYIPWRDEVSGRLGAYCFPCWGVRYALGAQR
jgi:hypothetical protein